MITLNGYKINAEHFPDGTQRLMEVFPFSIKNCEELTISWHYKNEEELVTLLFIVMHIREHNPSCKLTLVMPYIPNARMDRVHSENEVFTLKHFASVINSLKFERVIVYDAHSDVSCALIDRVNNIQPPFGRLFGEGLHISFVAPDTVIYFPDKGAYKRYSSMKCFKGRDMIYGEKRRDWASGKILGLDIITNGVDIKGRNILMVDDIIAFGGTLYHSAIALKALGVNEIDTYVTHTEESMVKVGDKEDSYYSLLRNGLISYHFTTNSIDSEAIASVENVKIIKL